MVIENSSMNPGQSLCLHCWDKDTGLSWGCGDAILCIKKKEKRKVGTWGLNPPLFNTRDQLGRNRNLVFNKVSGKGIHHFAAWWVSKRGKTCLKFPSASVISQSLGFLILTLPVGTYGNVEFALASFSYDMTPKTQKWRCLFPRRKNKEDDLLRGPGEQLRLENRWRNIALQHAFREYL